MDKVPLLKTGEWAIQIGTVIKPFSHLKVAGVNPSLLPVAVNDTVIFSPARPDGQHKACRITVASLEIDHVPVQSAMPGQLCGIELGCSCSELPRAGDPVYKVIPAGICSDDSHYPPRALADGFDNDGAC